MRRRIPVIVLAAMLLVSGAALAGEAARTAPTVAASPAAAAVVASPGAGMVVFVDPTTKAMRQPTAEEMAELIAAARASAPAARPVEVKKRPDGSVIAVLDASFQSYAVVTRGPDGKLVMGCVDSTKKAEDLVSKGHVAPAKEALDEK